MGVTTEPPWVYMQAATAARNGTTSHTVSPSTAATAGNYLALFVAGGVMNSASGWTEQQQPVNSAELSLFTKTAAGNDSITITHNASNYAIRYVWIEFPAGTTITNSVGSTAANNTFPALGSLPGTEQVILAALCNDDFNGGGSASAVWSSPWVEDDDTYVPQAATDGIYLTVAHQLNYTGTSITPSASITSTISTTDKQKVVAAFNVPAISTPQPYPLLLEDSNILLTEDDYPILLG